MSRVAIRILIVLTIWIGGALLVAGLIGLVTGCARQDPRANMKLLSDSIEQELSQ